MQLYNITNEYRELMDLSDEIDSETLLDTLEGIRCEFNDKALNIVRVCKNIEVLIAGGEQEIKRLQKAKKQREATIAKLKEYLLINMEATSSKKIESAAFTISVRVGVNSVFVADESKIPNEYTTATTTIKVDKRLIKKALDDGIEVSGAELKRGPSSIIFK